MNIPNEMDVIVVIRDEIMLVSFKTDRAKTIMKEYVASMYDEYVFEEDGDLKVNLHASARDEFLVWCMTSRLSTSVVVFGRSVGDYFKDMEGLKAKLDETVAQMNQANNKDTEIKSVDDNTISVIFNSEKAIEKAKSLFGKRLSYHSEIGYYFDTPLSSKKHLEAWLDEVELSYKTF